MAGVTGEPDAPAEETGAGLSAADDVSLPFSSTSSPVGNVNNLLQIRTERIADIALEKACLPLLRRAIFQFQTDDRILAREAHIKVEVWQTHDLLVVDNRVIDLVFTERYAVTHLVQTVAVLLTDFALTLIASILFESDAKGRL